MKKVLIVLGKIVCIILIIGTLYLVTLCFPEPFYGNKQMLGNITLYSDEALPSEKTTEILQSVQKKIEKSVLYKSETKHRIFITNNTIRWVYFTPFHFKVGGLNYTIFVHSIFLRKADVPDNRLYGPSGNKVSGNRTLDYFIAHEITHTLEYQSMPWYKYPINTNWMLEGYSEYIAHDSKSYESALNDYLTLKENTGAKYYTRVRTMTAYLLEIEKKTPQELWSMKDQYDVVLKKAIPDDRPALE